MAMVEGRNLYRFFRVGDDEVTALRDVSISIDAGEIVALVGASGSGKSTLLACLAGLDEPSAGFVTIAGSPISRQPDAGRARLRARHIGMLMQSGTLLDHLSVRENLNLQQYLAGRGEKANIVPLLKLLGIAENADSLPKSLSGGEVARAGLAVALAADAPILMCDEPTAEVDAGTESIILLEIERRRSLGTAVLIATHSKAVASIATRVVELSDGRLAHG